MTSTLLRFTEPGTSTAEIVAGIIRVYFPDARTALDLTPGHGCFWSELVPIGVTVEASAADFRDLPYADSSSDLVAYDPPHLEEGGQRSIMAQRYGTYGHGELEQVVRAGAREAWRVAHLGVIAKVTDHVHRQRFVRMSGWLIDELGEPYDLVHQVRAPLRDPKWHEPALSARNNGATYLIFRHGDQRHVRRPRPQEETLF